MIRTSFPILPARRPAANQEPVVSLASSADGREAEAHSAGSVALPPSARYRCEDERKETRIEEVGELSLDVRHTLAEFAPDLRGFLGEECAATSQPKVLFVDDTRQNGKLLVDLGIHTISVIALDSTQDRVNSLECDIEDFLTKPVNPAELLARIVSSLPRIKELYATVRAQAAYLDDLNRSLKQAREGAAQLERLGRLKRFFSPQLAELIVAGGAEDPLNTHRREVTVVFLDLRGFTAFAETSEPEEVMEVLREYHAEMGRLIVAHEGTLERFTGDGMMIFFNDPVPVPNPAERAIRMSCTMRDRVAKLTGQWRKRGYDLDFGVGIAQGYATIGAIGFEGRWDYGAIGTVTNLAARLCGEAKPGQILVSRRFLGTVEDLVETEPEGNVTLKGFVRPVPVFNVVGLKTDQGGTHAWTPTCSSSIRPPRPAPGPKRGARCRSTARYWSQRLRCWRRAG